MFAAVAAAALLTVITPAAGNLNNVAAGHTMLLAPLANLFHPPARAAPLVGENTKQPTMEDYILAGVTNKAHPYHANVKPYSTINAGSTIAFTVEGKTPTRLAYAFIPMEMDIKALRDDIRTIQEKLHDISTRKGYKHHHPDTIAHSMTRTNQYIRWPETHEKLQYAHARARLIALASRLNRLLFLFTPVSGTLHHEIMQSPGNYTDFLVARHARLAPFVAAAIAAAATIGLVWTARELMTVHNSGTTVPPQLQHAVLHDQVALGYTTQELAILTNNVIGALEHAYSDLKTAQHVHVYATAAEQRATMMENALQAASNGRLSVQALMQFDFGAAVIATERSARRHGLQLMSHHLTDWLQYEASFVATGKGFDVLLHIPLSATQKELTLYKFHPLPIALDDHLHLKLTPGMFTHLAITDDRQQFRAMTAAEVNVCRRVGTHFLCDLGTVTRSAPPTTYTTNHKDPEMCLYALFTRRFGLATSTCDADIVTAPDAMVMMTPNLFAFYTTTPQAALISCPGATPQTTEVSVVNTTIIFVPFGCTGTTQTHQFSAADSSFSRPATEWRSSYDWPAAVHDVTQGVDSAAIKELLKDSSHLMHRASKVSLATATDAHKLAEAQSAAYEAHTLFTPAIATVIAVAAMAYAIFLHQKIAALTIQCQPTPAATSYHAGTRTVQFIQTPAPVEAIPKNRTLQPYLHPLLRQINPD